jgi:PAS domain-containing protein
VDRQKSSYDELKRRLEIAESALEALRNGEVDTIIGKNDSLVVRIAEIEKQFNFQSQLLENVKESVVATDLNGNVTYWNKGAEALYGYSAGETMGHRLPVQIVDPPHRLRITDFTQIPLSG